MEDFILRRVGSPIEEKVQSQECYANQAVPFASSFGLLLFAFGAEEHEDGDADGYERDDGIFVSWELASVENDVHDEDRDEFARFGQGERWVGDAVSEGM